MYVWIICEAQVTFVSQTNMCGHGSGQRAQDQAAKTKKKKKHNPWLEVIHLRWRLCWLCESSTIWSPILLGKPAAFVGHGPAEPKRESTQSRRSRADVCRCLLCTQPPPSAVGHLCVLQKKPEGTCERNVSASRGRTGRSGVGGADREHWIPSPPPYSTSG